MLDWNEYRSEVMQRVGGIAVHAEAAVKAGATEEEIAEALGVAINLNAGAAVVYSARTLDAIKQLKAQ